MGALSRAVALRFADGQTLEAGGSIQLGITPTARDTSRTVSYDADTTSAEAVARGLGAGDSRAYSQANLDAQPRPDGIADLESYYDSPNLTIKSGGGLISGAALATSLAQGAGGTISTALATNIGLANVSYVDRYGGKLSIGSDDVAFSATALAASDNTIELRRGANSTPISTPATPIPTVAVLEADAIVRGFETDPGSRTTVLGQPNANVAARASLEQLSEHVPLDGRANAEAIGLERLEVSSVPDGNGDGSASISGKALAETAVTVGSGWDRHPNAAAGTATIEDLDLRAQALGITESTINGNPTLNTVVDAAGLARIILNGSNNHLINPSLVDSLELEGIGLNASMVFTNRGDDTVRAFGGVDDAGISYGNRWAPPPGGDPDLGLVSNPLQGYMQTAGMRDSQVYTGMGNDRIEAGIYTEAAQQIDVNGDGVFSDSVFLDYGARDPFVPSGYNGFLNSTVDAGEGDDVILGSSNGSFLFGSLGNDTISLERAMNSSLWGGLDDDTIAISGPVRGAINLFGGLGNDRIQAGSQADGVVNVQSLDGGFGQDILIGGLGVDRFLFGNGGAALSATSSTRVNELLTDPAFWSGLSGAEKELIWREGVVLAAQPKAVQDAIRAGAGADGRLTAAGSGASTSVDTITDFESGAWRDSMELSGALAGMTQEIWQSEGTLFGVNSAGDLSVIETSSPHPNRIGLVAGALSDIHKLGIGSPQLAYATDSRQLMYDADGDWSQGSISLGTVNLNGGLAKSNFRFGSGATGTPDSGAGLGLPDTAPLPS